MAKKELNEDLRQLKVEIQDNKIIFGFEQTLKGLKEGTITTAYVSKNCPDDMKEDIFQYSKLQGIPAKVLELDNEELGLFCKKNFFISVLGAT